jgi:CheY-like chemotaxis protein
MKLKLLQIDDDSINNMANERLLKKMGIELEVTNFLNPSEAISFLTNGEASYDLMLLDINMPQYSGWEFLEKYASLNNTYSYANHVLRSARPKQGFRE